MNVAISHLLVLLPGKLDYAVQISHTIHPMSMIYVAFPVVYFLTYLPLDKMKDI